MSDSLWLHELHHTRLPCPSLSPRACSNSCPLNQWCHPTICHPLLLLPSVFPSVRVFSNESALPIRWPKYWGFSISPSNEYSRLISLGLTGLISMLIFMANRWGNNENSDRLCFLGLQNHYRWWLQPWNEKMLAPWKMSYDKPRQQRHYLTDKVASSQSYGFSSSCVWMWELDCEKSWGPKNWCFWTVVWKDSWESLGLPGDPTSPSFF